MKDIRKLLILAKRLLRRGAHLKPQTDHCWLSRELEKAKRSRTDLHPNDRDQTKTETLRQAGIPISTANDYEQLTGGREEQAQKLEPDQQREA